MVGEGSGKQWPTYDPAKQNVERISLKPPKPERALPATRCEFLASLLSEKPKVPGEHQQDERMAALEGKGPVSPHPSQPSRPPTLGLDWRWLPSRSKRSQLTFPFPWDLLVS